MQQIFIWVAEIKFQHIFSYLPFTKSNPPLVTVIKPDKLFIFFF